MIFLFENVITECNFTLFFHLTFDDMYHIPSHATFDPWFNIYSFHFMIELNYRQPALIIRHPTSK